MKATRRRFVATAAALAGVSAFPFSRAGAQTAKYVRYNANSAQGQAMLESYATAIKAMLKLEPSDPRNWFRNAFVHTIDCPHMNWWFFVWHRGYLGWFEQTVRDLSGNDKFAFPYWDWSQTDYSTPGYCIPTPMLSGVLTPIDEAFAPFTASFDRFYQYMNPSLQAYWKTLSSDQMAALRIRKMDDLDALWTQVKAGMFQVTPKARYLRTDNSCLDENTQKAVAKSTVEDGLSAPTFAEFNSGQCAQHSLMGKTYGVLESQPHNLTHNNIGGYQHVPNPDVGFMADNLSPVDPIFFLHHANMDRLWDVWTRKQQSCGQPYLPSGKEWEAYAPERFMFYMNYKGEPVTQIEAGSYVDMKQFDYVYEPGTGEEMIGNCPKALTAEQLRISPKGKIKGGTATVELAPAHRQPPPGHPLIAKIEVPYPATKDSPRIFSVLVDAPEGYSDPSPSGPYYAGSISFFGFMPGMAGMKATFSVPLTRAVAKPQVRSAKELKIQVLPQSLPGRKPPAPTSTVEAASVTLW